jgi:Protein of unknown function (DUF3253)
MVAPENVGRFAASLLVSAPKRSILYREGPERYSPNDVAAAMSTARREQWQETLQSLRFSAAAAASYARMTAIALAEKYDKPVDPTRGVFTLEAYVGRLSQGKGPIE